jgi:hypothetical protein
MGMKNCNMHFAQKLSPTPKSNRAFWFKHTNKQQHQHRGNKPFCIKDTILWGLTPAWPYCDHAAAVNENS